jgi:hypothetical protein
LISEVKQLRVDFNNRLDNLRGDFNDRLDKLTTRAERLEDEQKKTNVLLQQHGRDLIKIATCSMKKSFSGETQFKSQAVQRKLLARLLKPDKLFHEWICTKGEFDHGTHNANPTRIRC